MTNALAIYYACIAFHSQQTYDGLNSSTACERLIVKITRSDMSTQKMDFFYHFNDVLVIVIKQLALQNHTRFFAKQGNFNQM